MENTENKTKWVRANVNLFFEVPVDYEVTGNESTEFLGEVLLRGQDSEVDYDGLLARQIVDHCTIEVVDTEDIEGESISFGDFIGFNNSNS